MKSVAMAWMERKFQYKVSEKDKKITSDFVGKSNFSGR